MLPDFIICFSYSSTQHTLLRALYVPTSEASNTLNLITLIKMLIKL